MFENARNSGLAVRLMAVLAALGICAGLMLPATAQEEEPFIIPAPEVDVADESGTAKAVFAAGCFWGVQAVYQHVDGVMSAVSGYSGGAADTAVYEAVGTGRTGHAEVVEVTYDPSVVTYGELLHILFSVVHDPTQLNYQGPDHGPQYRSAIFPMSEEQRAVAEAYIAQLDATGVYPEPIVTTLETFEAFYPAEEYHQDFLERNPNHSYIVRFDLPKLANLQSVFPGYYRDEPTLVLAAAN